MITLWPKYYRFWRKINNIVQLLDRNVVSVSSVKRVTHTEAGLVYNEPRFDCDSEGGPFSLSFGVDGR